MSHLLHRGMGVTGNRVRDHDLSNGDLGHEVVHFADGQRSDGGGFRTFQFPVTDDAYQMMVFVHYRQKTAPLIPHQGRHMAQLLFRGDRVHLACHDLFDIHRIVPGFPLFIRRKLVFEPSERLERRFHRAFNLPVSSFSLQPIHLSLVS